MQIRWIMSGSAAPFGVRSVAGGNLYLGDAADDRPEVLDPRLPMAGGEVAIVPGDLGAHPSWLAMSPVARRMHLEWLNGGRRNPGIGMGHILLHLAGFERRLLIERVGTGYAAMRQELLMISAAYGGIHAGLAERIGSLVAAADDITDPFADELPSRVALLADYISVRLPPTDPPEPSDRVLAELFRIRAAEAFPGAIPGAAAAPHVVLDHAWIGWRHEGSLLSRRRDPLESPDVVDALDAILYACRVELEPFLALTDRWAAAGRKAEGVALLPEPMRPRRAERLIDQAFESAGIGNATIVTSKADLARAICIDPYDPEAATAALAVAAAAGYDAAPAGAGDDHDEILVLHRPGEAPSAPSAFLAAVTIATVLAGFQGKRLAPGGRWAADMIDVVESAPDKEAIKDRLRPLCERERLLAVRAAVGLLLSAGVCGEKPAAIIERIGRGVGMQDADIERAAEALAG